ncbi:putative protein-serine/threonine phosphatase [Medicago truncatula]|uniref:PPM-type phosphatase domain-containing protein n=2 Tax=Medicago truncatula TaxID=3880 RepID=A0A396GX20_MEDTR|nr:probable protein phosphatase 2C 5 [Medicago truncatula]RHN44998.1 putative protein-serine/threonine phosphatase [Medicago truncatula]
MSASLPTNRFSKSIHNQTMSRKELSKISPSPVSLATLLDRELREEKGEKRFVKYGEESMTKKGEDYGLIKTCCHRVPGDPSTAFSVFAIFDGHSGISAAVYAKENLLNNVLKEIPKDIISSSRDAWLHALPRALVAGFVKTDMDFQSIKGEMSGTTATFVVVDESIVTVASVGDSRCILVDNKGGGVVSILTVDHRLEDNVEERERVIASGGEVKRQDYRGGPLRVWPGGLCLSRSIGDADLGKYIVPIPHVKQVKLLSNGGNGRLIIASDGVWDALSNEMAAAACRGVAAEFAAKLVVEEAIISKGLRDDTSCIVVDIPSDHLPVLQRNSTTQKKLHNLLKPLLFPFRKKSKKNSTNKATSKVGVVVEDLFEEGSVFIERFGNDFSLNNNSDQIFSCAICQVDQRPGNGISRPLNSPLEVPFFCTNCRKKKVIMEGKRPMVYQ